MHADDSLVQRPRRRDRAGAGVLRGGILLDGGTVPGDGGGLRARDGRDRRRDTPAGPPRGADNGLCRCPFGRGVYRQGGAGRGKGCGPEESSPRAGLLCPLRGYRGEPAGTLGGRPGGGVRRTTSRVGRGAGAKIPHRGTRPRSLRSRIRHPTTPARTATTTRTSSPIPSAGSCR